MGQLILSNQGQDFVAMIEKVTEGMVDLSFRDSQALGYFGNGFALAVQRDDMAHRHSQTVDHWFPAADAFKANDVRMIGFQKVGHATFSKSQILPQL
jgi:hypothetical protein